MKRLGGPGAGSSDSRPTDAAQNKRQNLGGGQFKEVPHYQEISVKNLYEDALKDELLVKYLPSKEQLSGRLPERDFFFGVLCTLRNQYMKDIVAEAHKARFTVEDGDP